MSRLATPAAEVYYPETDGEPMAETAAHVRALLWLYHMLGTLFADRPDVLVAANMFWYWQQGDPGKRVAPDVMVVPGVGRHDRTSFRSWEENGAVPAVVVELSSKETVKEDLGKKFERYEQLGVREYFLFDPEGCHLDPALQGFRLVDGRYERLLSEGDVLDSELGFGLVAEGDLLRVIDRRTGQRVLTPPEAAAEARRAGALAAEVERLKRLLGERPS